MMKKLLLILALALPVHRKGFAVRKSMLILLAIVASSFAQGNVTFPTRTALLSDVSTRMGTKFIKFDGDELQLEGSWGNGGSIYCKQLILTIDGRKEVRYYRWASDSCQYDKGNVCWTWTKPENFEDSCLAYLRTQGLAAKIVETWSPNFSAKFVSVDTSQATLIEKPGVIWRRGTTALRYKFE